MSLSRSIFIIAVCTMLTACGFEPLYGDAAVQAAHTPLQGNLVIDPVGGGGRPAQLLKNTLEDRFNPEGIKYVNPDYHLEIGLIRSLIPAVVKSDGTIQRYDVHFDSTFTLRKNGVTKPLLTGTLKRTGSYNVATNANFATYEAEQDVTERVLKEMAEDYMLRITSYFAGK